MDELLFSSKRMEEIMQIVNLLRISNINYFIKLCSKIPLNNNLKYSLYNNEFEDGIILTEYIENFHKTLSENEYFYTDSGLYNIYYQQK